VRSWPRTWPRPSVRSSRDLTLGGALLDTSVVIASGGDIDLPETAAISVITVGELRAGVLLARTEDSRRIREARFRAVQEAFEPLPVSAEVALAFGDALGWTRSEGRSERATDLLIVATAKATDRALYTLDRAQASVATGMGVRVER
jgi:predicted nucleic acid-binding protein